MSSAAEGADAGLVGAEGGLAFRDEAGAFAYELAKLVGSRSRIDARAMAAWAGVFPPCVPGETPYEGIEVAWSSCAHETRPLAVVRDSDIAASALRFALERVVDRALTGIERVAVLAGGGVDSAVLLALAARWARRTGGSAFGVATDFRADGDDRPHLRALAAHLGCEVIRIRPEDAAGRVMLVHEGVDAAPLTWPTAPLEIEMMARAKEAGAECVLTGIGGDELFDGDPRALSRLVLGGHPLRAVASAFRMRGFSASRAPVLSWLVRPLLVEFVPRSIRVRRARSGLVASIPRWAGPTLRSVASVHADVSVRSRWAPRRDGVQRFREFVRRPHRRMLAWLRHQEEVAAGVPRRDPYLDLGLVRFVQDLPPEWLITGGRRRGLLRDALRGVLPESLRERTDKSYFEPALERMADAAGGLRTLLPLAKAERLAELGIVELRPFAEVAESFLASPKPEEWPVVWPALACEAFLRARGAPA